MIKLLLTAFVIVALFCMFKYGTLSPCDILRDKVHKDNVFAAHLPDSLVKTIEDLHNSLTSEQCTGILAGVDNVNTVPAVVAQPQNQTQSQQMQIVAGEIKAIEQDCRNKRLNGELKTYVGAASCANPRIVQAFQSVHYPYMDLVEQLTAERLEVSERLDAKTLTEGQAQLEMAKFSTTLSDIERRRNKGTE